MSARLDRALGDCDRLARSSLGTDGWFVLLLVETAPGGMVGSVSNAAADVARRVVISMVSANGESALPACPPPVARRRWMREELPRLAAAIVDRHPEMMFALIMWFGEPDGLASLFVAANVSREDVVGGFGEWLERTTVREGRMALRSTGELPS